MHWLHGRFKLNDRHDKIDSWSNGKRQVNPIGRGISKNKDSSFTSGIIFKDNV